MLLLILFIGCSQGGEVIELWSNQPEFAAYVEVFNAQEGKYRIISTYKRSPATALLNGEGVPALIIDKGLNSKATTPFLKDLSPVLNEAESGIDQEAFYAALLNLGRSGKTLVALPVSFDLPVLYYKKFALPIELSGQLLSWPELREVAHGFDYDGNNSRISMGFSPLWNGEYLYQMAFMDGSNFKESDAGYVTWNSDRLEYARNRVLDWFEGSVFSISSSKEFAEKYLYQPGFKLILSERVLLQYSTLHKFYRLPGSERGEMDFLWVSNGEFIPVLDNLLFIGIPRYSDGEAGAMRFLSWFFRRATQEQLLELSRKKRISGFGIGQGLSSLREINELSLPRFFPILAERVPGGEVLLFPESLPLEWERIKGEVVLPWLLEYSATDGDSKEAPLEDSLADWYLLNPRAR